MIYHENSSALIALQISKEEVEKDDIARAVAAVKTLEKGKLSSKNSLFVIFDGYDDDPREIYEIDTIRTWMKAFAQNVPHYLYFIADHLGDNHVVTTACLCDVESVYEGEKSRSLDEYAKEGQNLLSLPKKYMKLSMGNALYQMIERGILSFGTRIGDHEGAKEKIALLDSMVERR